MGTVTQNVTVVIDNRDNQQQKQKQDSTSGSGGGDCDSCNMSDVPVASNLVIAPEQPDIGVDDITGAYSINIANDCGEDVSTYAYITSKGGGGVLQSGTIEVSGVIPSYTPIPSDNQADIHVELTPLTSCGQVGQTIESNTVVPANNPMEDVVVKSSKTTKATK